MDQQDQQHVPSSDQPNSIEAGTSAHNDTDLSAGQTSASGSKNDLSDTSEAASPHSTSAQRSGGQSDGGTGMGNASFEGTSLAGQTSANITTAKPTDLGATGQQGNAEESPIDPTTGQISKGYAHDGQGAPEEEVGTRSENPLDGE